MTRAPYLVVDGDRRWRGAADTRLGDQGSGGQVAATEGLAAVRSPSSLPAGAADWLRSGERGISSEAIFSHLTGIPVSGRWGLQPPSDPDDLRRCRLLLEAVPAFAAELHRMAEVSEEWAALVARWDELCATMDREAPEWRAGMGRAPETYAIMRALR